MVFSILAVVFSSVKKHGLLFGLGELNWSLLLVHWCGALHWQMRDLHILYLYALVFLRTILLLFHININNSLIFDGRSFLQYITLSEGLFDFFWLLDHFSLVINRQINWRLLLLILLFGGVIGLRYCIDRLDGLEMGNISQLLLFFFVFHEYGLDLKICFIHEFAVVVGIFWAKPVMLCFGSLPGRGFVYGLL